MRIKNGLIVQQIDNDFYVIDSGEEEPRFNGMVKLNETSHFIVDSLSKRELTIDELYDLFLNEYEVNKSELIKSVPPVIKELEKIGIIK